MPGTSLLALASVAFMGNGCEGTPEAERYLRLCLGRSFGRAVFATLDQRDPTSATGRIQTEIIRDSRGRMLSSIVAPSSLKGNAILDDGTQMSVLLGKEKLVMIQDSPSVAEDKIDDRIKLVLKNYRLKVNPGPRSFERPTVILDARARHRGIDSRRYLLDAGTGYPLRHDVLSDGAIDNLFNTLALRFADRAPRGMFRAFSTEGRQVVKYASAGRLKPGEAKSRVGFEPVIPKDLPFGFRASDVGLNDMPGWKSVVFRATDGLVKANVYQWASNPADAALTDARGRSVARRSGRTVMVISDGSALVRVRLLDAVLDAMR